MLPPANAPTMVAASPKTLLTAPTSVPEKPAPRNKKVVDKAPANASPSLYSTISNSNVQAPLRPKNSFKGATTASRKEGGACTCNSGSGAKNVAKVQIPINKRSEEH